MTIFYDKNDVVIRESRAWDIDSLKDKLRESDRLEILASNNQKPYEALAYGFNQSKFCSTVLYKNEPVAMFGVVAVPGLKGHGVIWLLASEGIYRMRWTFLKLSKKFIKHMQTLYPYLHNYIDPRNAVTVGWLVWCGADLGDPAPIGFKGEMLQHFTFDKGAVLV